MHTAGRQKRFGLTGTLLALAIGVAGFQGSAFAAIAGNAEAKGATDVTAARNEAVYALLDFEDEQELAFAQKGLIAAPEKLEITDGNGKLVWSQAAYAFLEEAEAPDTANPSLWRNAQLNHLYGLFEVTEGIYQVRGYDMTNITFIKGDTGWIVFDPLMSVECAQAALALVHAELGEKPVNAVIMSHPHVDHYGGIKGIVSEEEVAARNIPIIAPAGFHEHAVSENVYAGNAMGRRASYQYGTLLDQSETGALSIGIGMGQSKGSTSYIAPNDAIYATGETRTIDGVVMEFQMTPGTEAPVEMNIWFPAKNALWLAENCTGTMHNLYTLRGAQVRDGNAWAEYIMEAVALYGDTVEVAFQSHNWPHWGNEAIQRYMIDTAAAYKFINDQTLMYLNQGYTAGEIAAMISLPEALAKNWYTRQYYGTVAHNARAVYQKYMGWYDANPVNLNALPPGERAVKLVEYLGDVDEVLRLAQADFEKGEYQWVAEITNALVFADPENWAARFLCADALEQLAYQAESGTWRNVYLSGAKELREGVNSDPANRATGSQDLQRAMTPAMAFDYMGILLDSNAAEDLNATINIRFTDGDPYVLTVVSGVLLYQRGVQADDADVTVTLPEEAVLALMMKDAAARDALMRLEGDAGVLDRLSEHMVSYAFFFNIVEP